MSESTDDFAQRVELTAKAMEANETAMTREGLLKTHPLPWSFSPETERALDANGAEVEPPNQRDADEFAEMVFAFMLENVNALKGLNPAAIPALVEENRRLREAMIAADDVISWYEVEHDRANLDECDVPEDLREAEEEYGKLKSALARAATEGK